MRCIIVDDDPIVRTTIGSFIRQTDCLIEAGQFGSSIEAINFLKSDGAVDLIFLDIQIPSMDGFEFLESLESPPQVIVMSASSEYALKAFDFGATDYLLKPISYARFFKGVSKALKWMKTPAPTGELYVKKNSSLVRVPYSSILWVESMENYIRLFTEEDRFTLHFTLKAFEGHLPLQMFRRIHRSFIVNLSRIQSIEENTVLLDHDGEVKTLPIGKHYKENLFKSLSTI